MSDHNLIDKGWGKMGQTTTGAPNVATRLTSDTTLIATQGVEVRCDPDESSDIYVGIGENIQTSSDSYRVQPGESLLVPTNKPSRIYVVSAGSGVLTHWMAM